LSVKLGRIIFRKVGGVFIPIRNTAKSIGARSARVLPELPKPQSIADYFHVKNKKILDFSIQRRGSEETIGRVRKGLEKYDIGIGVKDKSKIVSNYAKYAFMNLHRQGFWRTRVLGSTRLKHLRTSEVAKTSIEELFPTMKAQRADYESKAYGTALALSKKAYKSMGEAFKRGAKLKVNQDGQTARLVSGIDRAVNARAKGIRFIRRNGRIIPIRVKK